MTRIINKVKQKDPIIFTGKVLRELSEDKEFTLGKFKKRYSVRVINKR